MRRGRSWENSPKRATTNPKAIIARPADPGCEEFARLRGGLGSPPKFSF